MTTAVDKSPAGVDPYGGFSGLLTYRDATR
jgi:hypothetical protein